MAGGEAYKAFTPLHRPCPHGDAKPKTTKTSARAQGRGWVTRSDPGSGASRPLEKIRRSEAVESVGQIEGAEAGGASMEDLKKHEQEEPPLKSALEQKNVGFDVGVIICNPPAQR